MDTQLVRQILDEGTASLGRAGVDEPRRECRAILSHATGRTAAWLLAHPDAPVRGPDASVAFALMRRRARREPLAYLVGTRAWLDVSMQVNRNVLIPRPETELLAAGAIDAARAHSPSPRAGTGAGLCIADVGTGSGAIAVAVARALPEAQVVATEVSAGALRVARRNCTALTHGQVALFHTDLLAGTGICADVLVANLPYIPTAEISGLEPELQFEPLMALDGGRDGFAAFRALFAQVGPYLRPPADMLLECGHDQARALAAMAAARWPGARVHITRDYSAVERFVHIEGCG